MLFFVHPGKNSLVSFGSGVFCPKFLCSMYFILCIVDKSIQCDKNLHPGDELYKP